MAGYRAHIIGGIALYSTIIALALMEFTGKIELNMPGQLTSLLRSVVPNDSNTFIYSLITLIFGSLAPDLDHHASKIRGIVTSIALILLLSLFVLPMVGLEVIGASRPLVVFTVFILILAFIPRLFSHRSAWHWILGLIVGVWGIQIVIEQFGLTSGPLIVAYVIGYISHLLLDTL